MSKPAEYDDTCEYCQKPILVRLGHEVGTSIFFTKRKPGGAPYWIHNWCVDKLSEIEATRAQEEEEADKISLEEFDEPGPYDGPQFLTREETALRIGCSPSTLSKFIVRGYVECHKKNGRDYIQVPKDKA